MTLTLESERLILRSFEDSDVDSFVMYRSDPDVARYQGWEAPYSREKGMAFLDEMKNKEPGAPCEWYQMVIERRADCEMLGDVAFVILSGDALQAEIGITLAREHQGQGYGTEAITRLLAYLFQTLDLHRVRANCDPENLASVGLLERIGMRWEGYFVESLRFKGRWASEYWYAMLRREWRGE